MAEASAPSTGTASTAPTAWEVWLLDSSKQVKGIVGKCPRLTGKSTPTKRWRRHTGSRRGVSNSTSPSRSS